MTAATAPTPSPTPGAPKPSAPKPSPGPGTPKPGAPGAGPRINLRPIRSHRGAVDGGWWPRATTGDELTALADALAGDFGSVVRVAVDMATWPDIPRRLGTGITALRVDSFRTWEPGTVRVVRADGRVLDLLVVPPEADAASGEAALTAAGDADDTRPAAELLGRS